MELTTQAMMSSKEIAELTNKRRADVHSDIKNMLHQLYEVDGGNLHHVKNQIVKLHSGVSVSFDNRGYIAEYLLDYEHSECLVTGYDAKRRMAVIKRWRELETIVLEKPHSLLSLEQAKFGLALWVESCEKLNLSHASKLQGLRNLQKAAGLPDLFPD
ncbi:Rha family transcriptional regulator, partial [Yersinia ruckeri]